MAGLTGLEPATSGVTGRRCNRLYYSPASDKTENRKQKIEGAEGAEAAIFRFLFSFLNRFSGTAAEQLLNRILQGLAGLEFG
jgi:hypothetical protein